MTYFAETASSSVSISRRNEWFWAKELPWQAERSPFLLHGLSAVSALHLAERLPNNDSTLLLSRKHYTTATSQFRIIISRVDAENCVPIFALSLIVIVVQLKLSSRHPRHSPLVDAAFNPIDSLNALRGASGLLKAVGLLIKRSSVSAIFDWQEGEIDPKVEQTRGALLTQLDSLRGLAQDEVCRSALDNLGLWLESFQSRSKTWFQLAWWPAAVAPDFLSKLQMGHSVALIIYGSWCCGMHARYKEWFTQGYAGQAIQFVKAQLASSGELVLQGHVERLEVLVSAS